MESVRYLHLDRQLLYLTYWYGRKIHDDLLCNGCRNPLSNDIVRMPSCIDLYVAYLLSERTLTVSTRDTLEEQGLNSGKAHPSSQKHLDGRGEPLEQ